jgi:DNA mismatch repair protein MutL
VIPDATDLQPVQMADPSQPLPADMAPSLLPLGETDTAPEYSLLGQYLNSYILVEKDRKLLIIDQHNAHERVNYDKLKSKNSGDPGMGIAPLFPVIIELTPGEIRRFTPRMRGILKEIGFDIRKLSGNSIDVKSYPWFVEEQNIRDIIVSVLHLEVQSPKIKEKVIADIACRNAIKVNHALEPMEMKTLVDDLLRTGNPYFCPHKRPIIKELAIEDIEKMLKRR